MSNLHDLTKIFCFLEQKTLQPKDLEIPKSDQNMFTPLLNVGQRDKVEN